MQQNLEVTQQVSIPLQSGDWDINSNSENVSKRNRFTRQPYFSKTFHSLPFTCIYANFQHFHLVGLITIFCKIIHSFLSQGYNEEPETEFLTLILTFFYLTQTGCLQIRELDSKASLYIQQKETVPSRGGLSHNLCKF